MANENTSNITDPSQGGQSSNPPANVANSSSQGDTSTPNIEALQKQIEDLKAEAFKAREKERARKEQEQAAEASRQEQLRRNGEFEALTKQQQTTIDELKAHLAQQQAEIAKRDYDALRTKIAAKHGLPAALAARIVGQTEEELDKDAAQLKKLVPTIASPGNGPNPKPAGTNSQAGVDELRGRYRESGKYAF